MFFCFLEKEGKIILDITNKSIHYALYECVEGTFLVDERIYNVWFGTIGRNLRSEFGNQMIQKRTMNGNLPDFSVVYRIIVLSNHN